MSKKSKFAKLKEKNGYVHGSRFTTHLERDRIADKLFKDERSWEMPQTRWMGIRFNSKTAEIWRRNKDFRFAKTDIAVLISPNFHHLGPFPPSRPIPTISTNSHLLWQFPSTLAIPIIPRPSIPCTHLYHFYWSLHQSRSNSLRIHPTEVPILLSCRVAREIQHKLPHFCWYFRWLWPVY